MSKKNKFGIKAFMHAAFENFDRLVTLIGTDEFITIKILKKRLHIISDPSYIKRLFTDNMGNYVRKQPAGYSAVTDLIGPYANNSSEKQEWDPAHQSLSLLSHKAKMEEYTSTATKIIAEELDSWELFANKNTPMIINDKFFAIITRILMTIFLNGAQVDLKQIPYLTRMGLHFFSPLAFAKVKFLGLPLFTPSYFQYKKIKKQFNQVALSIVKQSLTAEASNDNIIKRLANDYGYQNFEKLDKQMLDRLMSHAKSTLFAGNDSSSVVAMYASIYLSLYPLMAEKHYDEVNTVLGTRIPTYDDLKKLVYTRAIVKETLRLQPPGTIQAREAVADDSMGEHKIKKGDVIIVSPYVTHRIAKYWPNPEGFDASRFSHPLTGEQSLLYLPFSRGERSCVGAEFALMMVVLLLSMIAQRFRLELAPGISLAREHEAAFNRLNLDVAMYVYKI